MLDVEEVPDDEDIDVDANDDGIDIDVDFADDDYEEVEIVMRMTIVVKTITLINTKLISI